MSSIFLRFDLKKAIPRFSSRYFKALFFLSILHLVVFSIVYPRTDLPVWDDCRYFGWGKALLHGNLEIRGDWTPVIVYFSSILHVLLFFLHPVSLYAVFNFLCQLIFIVGVFSLIYSETENVIWSIANTILLCILLLYWELWDGHAFASGLFLLILSWAGKKQKHSVWTIISIFSIVMLLRREFVLILAGYGLLWLYRIWINRKVSLLTPTRHDCIYIALSLLLWFPVLAYGIFSTNRLELAFNQAFAKYASQQDQYRDIEIEYGPSAHLGVKKIFPGATSYQDSFLSHLVPLYCYVAANPKALAGFIIWNVKDIFAGKSRLADSLLLSCILYIYVFVALLIVMLSCIITKNRYVFLLSLYLCIFYIISIFPTLITEPNPRYLLPAIVWFIAVIPYKAVSALNRTVQSAVTVFNRFMCQGLSKMRFSGSGRSTKQKVFTLLNKPA